jgi:hypothetical protein
LTLLTVTGCAYKFKTVIDRDWYCSVGYEPLDLNIEEIASLRKEIILASDGNNANWVAECLKTRRYERR